MKLGNKSLIIGLLLVGLLLVNYLASSLPFRLDATDDRIYTLSSGTRSLLDKIEEPVTLDFYFSRSAQGLPVQYKNFAERVQEMLRQYVRASGGKLVLNVIDPRPDTPEEERATASGLQPQMLQTGEQFSFGLVATQADQVKVITSFNPQRESFLEYDLSQLIHSVQQVSKRKLGLLSGLPLKAPPMDFMAMQQGRRPQPSQFILSEWEKSFEVISVEASATELPAGLDVLAVIHPQNLSPKLQYAIDQYLLSGKPVFVAVDPLSEHFLRKAGQQAMFGGQAPGTSSDLPRLFKAWGLAYDATKLVGDPVNAAKVSAGMGSIVSHPIWLNLSKEDLSATAQPTAQLGSLLFPDAGFFIPLPDSGLSFTPLVQSSEESGGIEAMMAQFSQPEELTRMLAPEGKKTLAALLTGNFKTAFPEGAPKDEKPADDKAAPVPLAKEPAAPLIKEGKSTLIVVADTDWLTDDFSVRRFNFLGTQAAEALNDNIYLGANVVEFLGGSSDLITIRGKGGALRPFTVVRDMELRAQKKYQEQLKRVEDQLADVQRRLSELQAKKGESRSLVASPEVRRALEDFQKQEAAARGERRQIRRALREDIDKLENLLIAFNLLASPLLVGAFGIWFYRSRRA